MFLIAISSLIIIGIASLIGSLLNCTLELAHFQRQVDNFIFSCWSGLFLIGITLLLTAFFLPLSPVNAAFSSSLLIVILYFFCFKKKQKPWLLHLISLAMNPTINSHSKQWRLRHKYIFSQPIERYIYMALLFISFCLMSLPVRLGDSGVYHFGAIKWLSEYGIVRGHGLLTEPLCNPSIWFSIFAPFNSSYLLDRMAALPGAVVMTLVIIQWGSCLQRHIKKQERGSDRFLFIALFLQIIVSYQLELANSPSPDLPNTVLPILTCWLLLLCDEEHQKTTPAFLSALMAVLIKFNALPTLLLLIILLVYQAPQRRLKKAIQYSLFSCTTLLLLLGQSIISCGCPFYPASLFCFQLPWAYPTDIAHKNLQSIIDHARWGGCKPPPQANNWNWLLQWWQVAPISFILVLSALIAAIIFMYRYYKHKNICHSQKQAFYIGGSGLLFMLISSPIARYGLGYLLILIALGLINHRITFPKTASIVLFLTLLFFLITDYKTQKFINDYINEKPFTGQFFTDLLIRPPVLKSEGHRHNLVTQETINDIHFFLREQAEWDQEASFCWSAPLPCTWPERAAQLQLRQPEKGISGGFIWISDENFK